MGEKIVFIDSEIDPKSKKILDLGAIKEDGEHIHTSNTQIFSNFVSSADFICGHNIIAHDLKYVSKLISTEEKHYIDTLCLSPLLFPKHPYHALCKDDKLQVEELNNPLNDSIKAKDLFFDELNAFGRLNWRIQRIFRTLLEKTVEFKGFFEYKKNNFYSYNIATDIKNEFQGKICQNADVALLAEKVPVELAYSLALIAADDDNSLTPPWVYKNYPLIDNVIKLLRNTPCETGCEYCNRKLDVRVRLKDYFGYDSFRTYNGEPLQEKAAEAAVYGKSLLAIFPTGGGKSITFQLPALMAGDNSKALTVVISPLQSLMKDQVDNLREAGITGAVTINGMLNPIERAEAMDSVYRGLASILYISPESLRSKSIENMLVSRTIARFVIDEAHCFSAWGQDFRVDYIYIGDFIRELQNKKRLNHKIPVSCFTATAKQKVISDIRDYFKLKLNIDLELFTTNANRENLRYTVLYKETEDEKYTTLRNLIREKDCPTIVYVSRTRRTIEIAEKLSADGFAAKPFNGKMENTQKVENQEAFMRGDVKIIVATSAFGMGVDKKDVKLVIHYDISDSLENYIQEAGRAGRDQSIQAECYVLFNNGDLDKHFILLNQTKLSISEIQQVWKAIKDLTRIRSTVYNSPLEIARQAGWDDQVAEIETRVKTAIAALESAGYIMRGRNVPQVFANSILVKTMAEASERIRKSERFDDAQKQNAIRIIKSLISSRSIAEAGNDDAESRVDWLADRLGLKKDDVIEAVNLMKADGLLADAMDLTAYIRKNDSINKSSNVLDRYYKLEQFILSHLLEDEQEVFYKELNDKALKEGIKNATIRDIKTILYFWTIRSYIQNNANFSNKKSIGFLLTKTEVKQKIERRIEIARFIIEYLYSKTSEKQTEKEEIAVEFSVLEIIRSYMAEPSLLAKEEPTFAEVQDALLYLSKIGAIGIEGGFFVVYNQLEIKRLVNDNKIRYKNEDYKTLNDFYQQKIQQIHIVGEYANMMVKNEEKALEFVNDYFRMDYRHFISKYFKGQRAVEINRNITTGKYNEVFGDLSEKQSEIIQNDSSQYIVVAAGPGSGKTKVLVHKLASLLLLEDVKHEQLLMLTFSRASATEFKNRLLKLIGNAAYFVEIKTFHSYCFDLLGKVGNIEDSKDIVLKAAELIENGEVEIGRITKTVLVIDEAQDMDSNEYALVRALMKRNEEMRVIAVGDDDQNIYAFRGSDSKYFGSFVSEYGATKYELVDNYRSKKQIVSLANMFASKITGRLKVYPIEPIQKEDGQVRITKYDSENLEVPVVEDIIKSARKGTTCVLTGTNDEALKIVGLLTRKGLRAKLIQSNEGFSLYNLAEIRYFLSSIDKGKYSPVINDDTWKKARELLRKNYKLSSCITLCEDMLNSFEMVNRTKYHTDFEEFLNESKWEDFIKEDNEQILVSTIHKAKGREFDNVYLSLSNYSCASNENKRAVYVGITRAKSNLNIFYNGSGFDEYKNLEYEFAADKGKYDPPNEIMLQLSYKDVFLDYQKNKQELIVHLRAGMELSIEDEFLSASRNNQNRRIVKLSKACIDKIADLAKKGFMPYKAEIHFVVVWKGEADEEETHIVLPNIFFKSI